VTDFLREVRPRPATSCEVRFETPPGEQAQVDFAQFEVVFTDEPGAVRKVWLFSLVSATAAATCRSSTAAAISSSNSLMRATKKAR
jgi:transposase